ncbi:MAG: tyrosine-type recombinase/integrase [Acidiferrobacter sp.]
MASFIPRKGPGGKRAWQAHVRRRGYPAQVRTFDTKAEAEGWASVIESEIARRVFVSRSEAESTTLAEALARYRREVTPAKKGASIERFRLDRWDAHRYAQRSMASIRGKDVADYIEERHQEGAAPATVHKELNLLSHLFNTARTAWGMESLTNPVDLVKGQRPKVPQGRDRRLVDDEYPRLLTAAATYGGEIGPIITWAIETAMRRSEIAAMRWEHLDRTTRSGGHEARVLLIPETKNGTPRRVPLSTAALAVLDGLPRRIDGRVWGMRPDSISQAFERVCKAAGIEGLTFHDLRHEATSRLFEKGLNPMQVAAITGHKTLQMLKRYTHLRAEDLVGMLG